jgi:hypothetical protein
MNLDQDTHLLTELQTLLERTYELADYARSKFDSAPLAIGAYRGHVQDDKGFCRQREQLRADIKSLLERAGSPLEYQRFVASLERRSPSIQQGYSPVLKGRARCRCWWDARDDLLGIADYLEELFSKTEPQQVASDQADLLGLDSQSLPEHVQEFELHVEDIDSFYEARNVKPQEVKALLPLDLLEDEIQTFFEEIIGENFHQEDWGGELNDLVTSQVKVGGKRIRAAFLLKGRGTRGKLTIAKCGKNGDQIVRLLDAPVDLYVIQHVGEIDQHVIYDLRAKVELKVRDGRKCQMCILDGTETARILTAYGKI